MTPRHCHAKITLSRYSETVCMRDRGHEGPCSIYLDHKPLPPQPLFKVSGTVTPQFTKEDKSCQ
jgi:hypothetical protein